MKKRKQWIGWIVSICMLVTITPMMATAAELPAPAHSKVITDNNDGTYTLTLNVVGAKTSEIVGKPADILLIIDTSESMKDKIGESTRLEKVQSLVKNLTSQVLPTGTKNRMAVVHFSGMYGWRNHPDSPYNDAWVDKSWTSQAGEVTQAVNGLGYEDGTNWEAGFYSGKGVYNQARTDAEKYVIFLSDGNPTFEYDSNGMTVGNGQDYEKSHMARAVAIGKTYTDMKFFSVGIGGNANRMKDLKNSLGGSYYDGTSEKALEQAFADISQEISQQYDQVSIADTLSANVELNDANPGTKSFQIRAVDADQKTIALPTGTSASYDKTTRTVKLAFPANYILEPGAIYSISFLVVPSQSAIEDYAANYAYPNKGDAETGITSAGKMGYYSNKRAVVNYNGKSTEYAMPVLQIPLQKITILPKAGGRGILRFLIGGGCLILLASGLLLYRKMNYSKGAEKKEAKRI